MSKFFAIILCAVFFLFGAVSCTSDNPISQEDESNNIVGDTTDVGDTTNIGDTTNVGDTIGPIGQDTTSTGQDSVPVTDDNDTIATPPSTGEFPEGSIHDGKAIDIWGRHAMLNRGINFSNWLEQFRMWQGSVWQYDEDDVRIAAELGFESLRLPVDFENYFYAGSSDYTDWSFDSLIFTIVDSFVVWTGRHGISLTIDQHSYSHHLTAESARNPDYIDRLKFMWKKVAYHYRNARSDVFLEIYNEPDREIGLARWWQIANEIVAEIRKVNQYHTIIVGPTDWYSISHLIHRPPQIADSNIIYAFHIYDPFLFTHQGASWTGMSTIRGIPFPYDSALMPDSYEAAGINDTPAHGWLRAQFDNYERIGSRAHIDSLVALAAAWMNTHNVPVICNEFGANSIGNTPEWRASYISVMVEIFERHNIPWQHWEWSRGFTIFNEEGPGVNNLLPGFREAFRLDR